MKKISLSKETLRVLTVQEADVIAGAASYKCPPTTTIQSPLTVGSPTCTLVELTSPAATCARDTRTHPLCVAIPISQASPQCPTV